MRFWLAIPLLVCVASGLTGNPDIDGDARSSFAREHTRQDPEFTDQRDRIPLHAPRPTPITPGQIIRSSAMIFSGTVLRVEHEPARQNPAPEITQITFAVNEAVRGVRHGEVIQVREWGGLWNSGERYEVGEGVFLFLYPPSKLGLTSPVSGAAGRFTVWREQVSLGPQHVFFKPKNAVPSVSIKDFVASIRRAEGE